MKIHIKTKSKIVFFHVQESPFNRGERVENLFVDNTCYKERQLQLKINDLIKM